MRSAKSWSYVRPVLVLLALALSVLLMSHARQAAQPVYYTQIDLRFLPPSKNPGNVLVGYSDSLINFAGVVERSVNGHDTPARFAAPTATLYGRGIRDGSSVTLVDFGGQWRTNFNSPVLSVEVVAPSERSLRAELQKIVVEIEKATLSAQESLEVPADQTISTSISPSDPVVQVVQGEQKRALIAATAAATLLVGGVLHVTREPRRFLGRTSNEETA